MADSFLFSKFQSLKLRDGPARSPGIAAIYFNLVRRGTPEHVNESARDIFHEASTTNENQCGDTYSDPKNDTDPVVAASNVSNQDLSTDLIRSLKTPVNNMPESLSKKLEKSTSKSSDADSSSLVLVAEEKNGETSCESILINDPRTGLVNALDVSTSSVSDSALTSEQDVNRNEEFFNDFEKDSTLFYSGEIEIESLQLNEVGLAHDLEQPTESGLVPIESVPAEKPETLNPPKVVEEKEEMRIVNSFKGDDHNSAHFNHLEQGVNESLNTHSRSEKSVNFKIQAIHFDHMGYTKKSVNHACMLLGGELERMEPQDFYKTNVLPSGGAKGKLDPKTLAAFTCPELEDFLRQEMASAGLDEAGESSNQLLISNTSVKTENIKRPSHFPSEKLLKNFPQVKKINVPKRPKSTHEKTLKRCLKPKETTKRRKKIVKKITLRGDIKRLRENGLGRKRRLNAKNMGMIVYPGPNYPMADLAQKALHALRSNRNKIDCNWARFAASAVATSKFERRHRMVIPVKCKVKFDDDASVIAHFKRSPFFNRIKFTDSDDIDDNMEDIMEDLLRSVELKENPRPSISELSVNIERIKVRNVAPWCLNHNCYYCNRCGLSKGFVLEQRKNKEDETPSAKTSIDGPKLFKPRHEKRKTSSYSLRPTPVPSCSNAYHEKPKDKVKNAESLHVENSSSSISVNSDGNVETMKLCKPRHEERKTSSYSLRPTPVPSCSNAYHEKPKDKVKNAESLHVENSFSSISINSDENVETMKFCKPRHEARKTSSYSLRPTPVPSCSNAYHEKLKDEVKNAESLHVENSSSSISVNSDGNVETTNSICEASKDTTETQCSTDPCTKEVVGNTTSNSELSAASSKENKLGNKMPKDSKILVESCFYLVPPLLPSGSIECPPSLPQSSYYLTKSVKGVVFSITLSSLQEYIVKEKIDVYYTEKRIFIANASTQRLHFATSVRCETRIPSSIVSLLFRRQTLDVNLYCWGPFWEIINTSDVAVPTPNFQMNRLRLSRIFNGTLDFCSETAGYKWLIVDINRRARAICIPVNSTAWRLKITSIFKKKSVYYYGPTESNVMLQNFGIHLIEDSNYVAIGPYQKEARNNVFYLPNDLLLYPKVVYSAKAKRPRMTKFIDQTLNTVLSYGFKVTEIWLNAANSQQTFLQVIHKLDLDWFSNSIASNVFVSNIPELGYIVVDSIDGHKRVRDNPCVTIKNPDDLTEYVRKKVLLPTHVRLKWRSYPYPITLVGVNRFPEVLSEREQAIFQQSINDLFPSFRPDLSAQSLKMKIPNVLGPIMKDEKEKSLSTKRKSFIDKEGLEFMTRSSTKRTPAYPTPKIVNVVSLNPAVTSQSKNLVNLQPTEEQVRNVDVSSLESHPTNHQANSVSVSSPKPNLADSPRRLANAVFNTTNLPNNKKKFVSITAVNQNRIDSKKTDIESLLKKHLAELQEGTNANSSGLKEKLVRVSLLKQNITDSNEKMVDATFLKSPLIQVKASKPNFNDLLKQNLSDPKTKVKVVDAGLLSPNVNRYLRKQEEKALRSPESAALIQVEHMYFTPAKKMKRDERATSADSEETETETIYLSD